MRILSCVILVFLAGASFVSVEGGRLVQGPLIRFLPSFAAFASGAIILKGWMAFCGLVLAAIELLLLGLLMGHVPMGGLMALSLASLWFFSVKNS